MLFLVQPRVSVKYIRSKYGKNIIGLKILPCLPATVSGQHSEALFPFSQRPWMVHCQLSLWRYHCHALPTRCTSEPHVWQMEICKCEPLGTCRTDYGF